MTSDRAIINILEEQVNTYTRLLELLNEERQSLVNINAEKIEEISKVKDTVVMRLRLLEDERVRLMKKFAEDNGILHALNLDDLAQHTGDNTFSDLRSRMLSILHGIEEMNKVNSILIDRSLRYIKTTSSFFSSFTNQQIPQTTGVLLSKES